jgi:hypothetical protein
MAEGNGGGWLSKQGAVIITAAGIFAGGQSVVTSSQLAEVEQRMRDERAALADQIAKQRVELVIQIRREIEGVDHRLDEAERRQEKAADDLNRRMLALETAVLAARRQGYGGPP